MASASVFDWLAIGIVFALLLLMFWGINDIISRCVEYWRAYRGDEER